MVQPFIVSALLEIVSVVGGGIAGVVPYAKEVRAELFFNSEEEARAEAAKELDDWKAVQLEKPAVLEASYTIVSVERGVLH